MPTQQSHGNKNMYNQHDRERRFKQSSSQPNRSEFETDKGRIVHSAAFRRLQGKTQVLGVGERDFYRTRLTHSLEVAQLGRGMCIELRSDSGFDPDFCPDPDLVETICLAHDIGHPPFGHSGESELNRLMQKYGGFGANPQNLRIVSFLEAKYDQGALDLTRATLDGLIKYPKFKPNTAAQNSKFTYKSDRELFNWVKIGVTDKSRKPIEGQIADWADQVAYCVNDIEDTLRAGLLSFVEVRSRADDISRYAEKAAGGDNVPEITDACAIQIRACELQKKLVEPKDIRQRKINLKKWTSDTIKELMHDVKIERKYPKESSMRYQYRLVKSKTAISTAEVLKSIAKLIVFDDPRVKTLQYKGSHIISNLFQAFRKDPCLLPLDFRQLLKKNPRIRDRLIADFISGVTDRYAFAYFNRLFQPGAGSFYEDV